VTLTQDIPPKYGGIGIGRGHPAHYARICSLDQEATMPIHEYQSVGCQADFELLLAFQVAHTFVKRSETAFLADELSWYNVVESFGLSIKDDQHVRLINFHSQSFALVRWVAERKFGPNYVVFSTPAANVRLTSLFAGEYEVNVIDPRKLTLIETRGCEIRRQEFADA